MKCSNYKGQRSSEQIIGTNLNESLTTLSPDDSPSLSDFTNVTSITPVQRCPSCQGTDHRRNTYKKCPKYKARRGSEQIIGANLNESLTTLSPADSPSLSDFTCNTNHTCSKMPFV